MKSINAAALVSAAAILMGAETACAFSEPVQINFAPSLNRQWSAICTNEVQLKWEWPQAATTAQLEINGMNQSSVIDFTEVTSDYLWRVFSGSVPSAEDVYRLTLSFYDNGTDLHQTLNSELAVVKGSFGAASIDFGPSDRKWEKVSDNVVIPYDSSWADTTAAADNSLLTISKQGGLLQSNTVADASGWFGWKIKNGLWGYGTFDLSLTFPGFDDDWTATLVRTVDGTSLIIK